MIYQRLRPVLCVLGFRWSAVSLAGCVFEDAIAGEIRVTKSYPMWLAGEPLESARKLTVTDKYTGQAAFEVRFADAEIIERAIAHADAAHHEVRALRPYERQEILRRCIEQFELRQQELAECLCIEVGKPLRDARAEVTRLIDTFRVAMEESVRINGEVLNLEISPRTRGYRGMTQRVPVGPCTLIAPFNFPLNLAAHKVAPAIAAGCPFILKPASITPVSGLIFGEILARSGFPKRGFSILPSEHTAAAPLIEDDRMRLLSFTGSPSVGWALKSRAGRKKVVLELGGNAACIVDEGTDPDSAVTRLIFGAFYQSGQTCISVQRILIHESIYNELRDRLVHATTQLQCGDPRDEATQIGPMISENEAQRVEQWMIEAEAAGGRRLCGGVRNGSMMTPALFENVPSTSRLNCEEVFGPVAVLSAFRDFEEAVAEVNSSRFGLQAGVFTQNLRNMQIAWDQLEVGGVIVGDVPSWRADNMPYGGVKESGIGREGVRDTILEMTETRLLVLKS